jgi:hypothetical protein
LVNKIGFEVHDHPHPYPLGQDNKDIDLKVTKKCKIKFVISANYIDEVEVNIVPRNVCGVVFGSPFMYLRDEIFMRTINQYCLIKDGKSFIINVQKSKYKISLVSANQDKKLINSSKKFVLLFLRENQVGDESVKVNASLEGCTKEKKQ